MPVTLNTIPPQSGEIVRTLVTAGNGGANAKWYSRRNAEVIGSASDDFVIVDGGLTITRFWWGVKAGKLRINGSGGSFTAESAPGGALNGKHLYLAVDGAATVVAPFDASGYGVSFANVGGYTDAQITTLNGVKAGDSINVVISDAVAAPVETAPDLEPPPKPEPVAEPEPVTVPVPTPESAQPIGRSKSRCYSWW